MLRLLCQLWLIRPCHFFGLAPLGLGPTIDFEPNPENEGGFQQEQGNPQNQQQQRTDRQNLKQKAGGHCAQENFFRVIPHPGFEVFPVPIHLFSKISEIHHSSFIKTRPISALRNYRLKPASRRGLDRRIF